MSTPGGLTETRVANEDIQKICNLVKDRAEEMAGKRFDLFGAISYRSQVVAGIMYYIKVYAPHEGKENFVHIEVFEDLEGNTELVKIQDGHKYPDPIEPL
ncbi:leukocyte cysteine proteinase inhibitor 1-like [Oryzias latipes]|uniref:leukocyte cysteine proteinase inhibitor 1-like n=1 Tax=Oryzias latipes TaxID=8090 RepID=UPI0000EA15B4|nr:leukocyte cysteine proteinase inhibitor 1-like [Oryzias latipes]